MILDVCKEWGQPPSWFYSLGHDDQVSILAHDRLPPRHKRAAPRKTQIPGAWLDGD